MVRYSDADCELGHFWSHRHPTATFVNHLVASRILDGEVRSLRNLGLRVVRGQEIDDIAITDGAHLHELLHSMFDIDVSHDEADALFAQVAARVADA
jgi:N-hydroxyarylamine O-acetyltransferase